MNRKIVIEIVEVKPPIPTKRFDFMATTKDADYQGWGRTELEAAEELLQLMSQQELEPL